MDDESESSYRDFSDLPATATHDDIITIMSGGGGDIDPSRSPSKPRSRCKGKKQRRGSSKSPSTFPAKLYEILSDPSFSEIVTWLPHGRSWQVHDTKAFIEHVAPTYFALSKYASFTRQVTGWCFRRKTQGPDRNSYYHELFLRGRPHLVHFMKRETANAPLAGGGRNDGGSEPDFYAISREHPLPAPPPVHAACLYRPPHHDRAPPRGAPGGYYGQPMYPPPYYPPPPPHNHHPYGHNSTYAPPPPGYYGQHNQHHGAPHANYPTHHGYDDRGSPNTSSPSWDPSPPHGPHGRWRSGSSNHDQMGGRFWPPPPPQHFSESRAYQHDANIDAAAERQRIEGNAPGSTNHTEAGGAHDEVPSTAPTTSSDRISTRNSNSHLWEQFVPPASPEGRSGEAHRSNDSPRTAGGQHQGGSREGRTAYHHHQQHHHHEAQSSMPYRANNSSQRGQGGARPVQSFRQDYYDNGDGHVSSPQAADETYQIDSPYVNRAPFYRRISEEEQNRRGEEEGRDRITRTRTPETAASAVMMGESRRRIISESGQNSSRRGQSGNSHHATRDFMRDEHHSSRDFPLPRDTIGSSSSRGIGTEGSSSRSSPRLASFSFRLGGGQYYEPNLSSPVAVPSHSPREASEVTSRREDDLAPPIDDTWDELNSGSSFDLL